MKKILFIAIAILIGIVANAQERASLTLVNKSDYTMTIKLMKSTYSSDSLHATITLRPRQSQMLYFGHTATYYTKTKAEKTLSPTVYKKGDKFSIYCGRDGYSEAILEFYLSSSGGGSMGQSISKAEFEKNN